MEDLTKRQAEIFKKIKERIETTSYFATNSDADVYHVFGQKWVSYRIISILINKGYLKITHHNPYKGYKYGLK